MECAKPIPNFEYLYEAHDDGTIWTKKGYHVYWQVNGKIRKRPLLQHRLATFKKHDKQRQPILMVSLFKNGHVYSRQVSRIMANLFVENEHGYRYVHHKNGRFFDNRASNLEWSDHHISYDMPNSKNAIKIKVTNIQKGDVDIFNTQVAAAQFLGINARTFSWRIQKKGFMENKQYEIKKIS